MRTLMKVRGNISVDGRDPIAALIRDMDLRETAKQWVSSTEMIISASGDRVSEMEQLALIYLNPHRLTYTVTTTN